MVSQIMMLVEWRQKQLRIVFAPIKEGCCKPLCLIAHKSQLAVIKPQEHLCAPQRALPAVSPVKMILATLSLV
jgi:hypothetical protein